MPGERTRGTNVWCLGGQIVGPLHFAGVGIKTAHLAVGADSNDAGSLIANRRADHNGTGDYGRSHGVFPANCAVESAQAINVAIAAADIDIMVVHSRSLDDALVHPELPSFLARIGMEGDDGSGGSLVGGVGGDVAVAKGEIDQIAFEARNSPARQIDRVLPD